MRWRSWALRVAVLLAARAALAMPVDAEYRFFRRPSRDAKPPAAPPADAQSVRRGFRWQAGRDWAWLIGELAIPSEIDGASSAGKAVGIRISCAEGGEVYVNGALETRYDNDKPALVLAAESAAPGQRVTLAIQAQTPFDKESENVFSEAEWVLLDAERALGRIEIAVDASRPAGPVPDGIIGLSQGGSMADWSDSTAAALREGKFRWFRMDNALTNCVKRAGTKTLYDFTELDRRLDFIHAVGAEPVIAASYMPEPLDAVPDPERHSAPLRFEDWEDLCFEAARHAIERGRRVRFWEVWNEPNTGWIKPCPCDPVEDGFTEIYAKALGLEAGKGPIDAKAVELLQAYLKLYAATARGVKRADPEAMLGGPSLASGPFETAERGHARNGKAFARGLMLYCSAEKLPLDFVSWHEYFHPPDVFRDEAERFRTMLRDFPELEASVRHLFVTEWNEAWWPDSPQDNELGAAWCASTVVRAFLPAGIDRPCIFSAKQGDTTFRGDHAILLGDNTPKPQLHIARIFNSLAGRWLEVAGGDGEVACVASRDDRSGRISVVLVNHTDRYNLRRRVRVGLRGLPASRCIERTVDATRSNAYHDRSRSALEVTRECSLPSGDSAYDVTLAPHSVVWLEITRKDD